MIYSTLHLARQIDIAELVPVINMCLTVPFSTAFVILSALGSMHIFVGNDIYSAVDIIWTLSIIAEDAEIAIDLCKRLLDSTHETSLSFEYLHDRIITYQTLLIEIQYILENLESIMSERANS